jgi:type IV fimbrial biogenesis protein FimT
MVVISIVAILAALAAPSFKTIMQRWRVMETREAMNSTFFLARSEAIKRGGNVNIGKIPFDSAICPQGSANATDWSCGWQIYFDNDRSGTYSDGDDTIIQNYSSQKSIQITLSISGGTIKLDRWGQANGAGAFNVAFWPYPDGSTSIATSTLCVSSGGRIRTQDGKPPCS